eukprot:COSAG01_NODE_1134_length_11558_cov_8.381360_10_plen_123_part_00
MGGGGGGGRAGRWAMILSGRFHEWKPIGIAVLLTASSCLLHIVECGEGEGQLRGLSGGRDTVIESPCLDKCMHSDSMSSCNGRVRGLLRRAVPGLRLVEVPQPGAGQVSVPAISHDKHRSGG